MPVKIKMTAKEAEKLTQKAEKNRLLELFTPEQAAVIQKLTKRVEMAEKKAQKAHEKTTGFQTQVENLGKRAMEAERLAGNTAITLREMNRN